MAAVQRDEVPILRLKSKPKPVTATTQPVMCD
jgi:hypothetical protein